MLETKFNKQIKIIMTQFISLFVLGKLKAEERENKQPDLAWSICITLILRNFKEQENQFNRMSH